MSLRRPRLLIDVWHSSTQCVVVREDLEQAPGETSISLTLTCIGSRGLGCARHKSVMSVMTKMEKDQQNCNTWKNDSQPPGAHAHVLTELSDCRCYRQYDLVAKSMNIASHALVSALGSAPHYLCDRWQVSHPLCSSLFSFIKIRVMIVSKSQSSSCGDSSKALSIIPGTH